MKKEILKILANFENEELVDNILEVYFENSIERFLLFLQYLSVDFNLYFIYYLNKPNYSRITIYKGVFLRNKKLTNSLIFEKYKEFAAERILSIYGLIKIDMSEAEPIAYCFPNRHPNGIVFAMNINEDIKQIESELNKIDDFDLSQIIQVLDNNVKSEYALIDNNIYYDVISVLLEFKEPKGI